MKLGLRNTRLRVPKTFVVCALVFFAALFFEVTPALAQTRCHPGQNGELPSAPCTPPPLPKSGPPFDVSIDGPYSRLNVATRGAMGLMQGFPPTIEARSEGYVTRTVKIPIPEGRAGLTPNLDIYITSGGIGGATRSTLNPGGKISRSLKNGPLKYGNPITSDTYDLGMGVAQYEMKNYPGGPIDSSCAGQNFRTEQETHMDICFDYTKNIWKAVDSKGQTYLYNLPVVAPGRNSLNPADDTSEWLLTEISDDRGNLIKFDYTIKQVTTAIGPYKPVEWTLEGVWYALFKDPKTQQIDKKLDSYHARVVHEPSASPTVNLTAGYPQQDTKRIRSIEVRAGNTPLALTGGVPDGQLVWTYQVNYEPSSDLIVRVDKIAPDGKVFPQADSFTYESLASPNGPNTLGWSTVPAPITNFPSIDLAESSAEVEPLDGDPFPDLIYTEPQPLIQGGCTQATHKLGYYKGQKAGGQYGNTKGPFAQGRTALTLPPEFYKNQATTTNDFLCPSLNWDLGFYDVNADGLADAVMVQNEASIGQYITSFTYVVAFNDGSNTDGNGFFPATSFVQKGVGINIFGSKIFNEYFASLGVAPLLEKIVNSSLTPGFLVAAIVESESPFTALMDMDGDGDLDLLNADPASSANLGSIGKSEASVSYFRFDPSIPGWDMANRVLMKQTGFNSGLSPALGPAGGIRVLDVNRDGLPDIVTTKSPKQKDRTPTEPLFLQATNPQLCEKQMPSPTSVNTFSYNSLPQAWAVYLNIEGKAFTPPQAIFNPPPIGLGGPDSVVSDFTGDGLPDILGHTQTYVPGSANDSATAAANFVNNPPIILYGNKGWETLPNGLVNFKGWDPVGQIVPGPNANWVPGQPLLDAVTDANTMFLDVDGSGRKAIFTLRGSKCVGAWPACNRQTEAMWYPSTQSVTPPRLLTQVKTEAGGTISYTYAQSHTFHDSVSFAPITYPVLQKVVMDNGMQSVDPNRHYQIETRNRYAEPLYDAKLKQYFGFEKRLQETVLSNTTQSQPVTETTYYQDVSRVGRTKEAISRDAKGIMLVKETTEYANDQDNKEPWFTPLQKKTSVNCDPDGRNCAANTAKYTYDHLKGVETRIIYERDPSDPKDDAYVNYLYAKSKLHPNVYKLASAEVAYPSATAVVGDAGASNLVIGSKTETFYDLALGTKLPAGPQTSFSGPGNTTQTRSWLQGGQSPVQQSQYDKYGNLIKKIDPNGNASTFTYDVPQAIGSTGDAAGTPTSYASFLIQEKNPKGHVTRMNYDKRLGVIKDITNPNGAVTKFTYDQFRRKTSTTLPGDTAPTTRTDYSFLDGSAPEVVVTYQASDINGVRGELRSMTIADGFKIQQSRAQMNINGNPTRESVVDNVYYNDQDSGNRSGWLKGATIARDEPFAANPGAALSPLNLFNPMVKNTYDDIGRITKITYPSGKTITTQYNEGSREKIFTETVSTNGSFRTKKIQRDVRDKVTSITEYGNGTVNAKTSFIYDRMSRLTNVTDPDGNKTTIGYDTLGRKTSMTDPSFGTWTYAYDQNGNVVNITDSKKQAITTAYDSLNRPIKEQISQTANMSSGNVLRRMFAAVYEIFRKITVAVIGGSNVLDPVGLTNSFRYDEASSLNGIGRLTSHDSNGGQKKQILYDQRGRISETRRTVNNTTYKTQFVYDSADHITDIRYPVAGDVVHYSYDSGGSPSSIKLIATSAGTYPQDIVKSITYNALGQRTAIAYGNGVSTSYTYDNDSQPDYLLETLNTYGTSGKIQDYTYARDLTGAITKIFDYGSFPAEKSFTYDDLGRLKIYTRDDPNLPPVTFSYTYSDSGNILNKGPLTLSYGAAANNAGPHAVSQMIDRTNPFNPVTYDYNYDKNGNLISKKKNGTAEYSVSWTPDNRVAAILNAQGTVTSQFVYDAEDTMTEARHNAAGYHTFYINPFYEEDRSPGGAGPVKSARAYYYDLSGIGPGKRIAYRDLKDTDPALPFRFYLSDYLGSITEVTDKQGGIMTQGGSPVSVSYGPWGDKEAGNPGTNKYLFEGKELDESGLISMGARFYDSATGRFISPDTLIPDPSDTQEWNRYGYVGNNPVNNVDPTGHQKTSDPFYITPYPKEPPLEVCYYCGYATINGVEVEKGPHEIWANINEAAPNEGEGKPISEIKDIPDFYQVGVYDPTKKTVLVVGGKTRLNNAGADLEYYRAPLEKLSEEFNVFVFAANVDYALLDNLASYLNAGWNAISKKFGIENEGVLTTCYGGTICRQALSTEKKLGEKNFKGDPVLELVPMHGGVDTTLQNLGNLIAGVITFQVPLPLPELFKVANPSSPEQEFLYSPDQIDHYFKTVGKYKAVRSETDNYNGQLSGKEQRERYYSAVGQEDGKQRPNTEFSTAPGTTHQDIFFDPSVLNDAINFFQKNLH